MFNEKNEAKGNGSFRMDQGDSIRSNEEYTRICMYFSTLFINTPIGKINDEINNALYEIGQFYDVECCYIFRFNHMDHIFINTNRWVMQGISIPEEYERTNLYEFKWMLHQIKTNKIFKISSLNEIPDEARKEKEYFEKLGCKSVLSIPIKHEDKILGLISLVTFNYEKIWTSEQIDLLKIICTIFSSAIERKIMDTELQEEYDELVKLKEGLKDSEEKFEKLSLSIQDAIIILDNEGNIINWNKAAEKIFGYTYQEVVGQKLHNFVIPPEYTHRVEEGFREFKITGTGKYINKVTEVHALRKDGTRFIAEISISAIQIKGKTHTFGIVRDISERRHTQKKLLDAMEAAEAANKAKSQFLANMSHEIRTPMNGMIGFLELLSKTKITAEQADYIGEIKNSSETLLNLINDLLDFSKIEANKMVLEHIEFNPVKVMEEVISSFALRAYSKGIELHAMIDDQIPISVKGDPGKLRQVLENLIGNAVKFTNKGKVVIEAKLISRTQDVIYLRFSVADTGIGIKKEDRAKLFEPFMQVDASTTRKYGGTGLGLSICEKLVEMMSGNIVVSSEAGKGSTFTFDVCFENGKDEPEKADGSVDSLQGLSILVADQSSTNRRIVKYYLESAGSVVTEAENAAETIEILKNKALSGNPVKVALLNNNMPDHNGKDLAARIKSDELIKNTIINLFTYYADPSGRNAKTLTEISGLIYKPVYRKELISSILSSLGKSDRTSVRTVKRQTDEVVFTDEQKTYTRILLVEDNATNQRLAANILKNAGLIYDIAENGRKALEMLYKNQYNLILMDCQMPEMDGYEAAKQIRYKEADSSHLTIVAMTANVMKSDINKCLKSGMDDFIGKPFKADDLLRIIEKWLNKDSMDLKQNASVENHSLPEDKAPEEIEEDIPEILDRLAQDQKIKREDIYEIYNEFADMLPDSLKKLQDAIDMGSIKEITMRAHTLKGASATLRLNNMSKIAAELEMQGKTGDLSRCRGHMKDLTRYCQKHIKNITL